MAVLKTYQDFVERVEELGFLALSNILPGFPSVSDETENRQWHTGDEQCDPWRWKDRIAEEKKAAYGGILGGNKGFISARMYTIFYTACHPAELMPEQWAAGQINQTQWQLWQLFEERGRLNTSEVRRALGSKIGTGRIETGLRELQRGFYITVVGAYQKVSKAGELYGWRVNVYDGVLHWAPAEWLPPSAAPTRLERLDAWETILAMSERMGPKIDRRALAQKLSAPNLG